MVDVNISTQDITVLTGPARVDLQVGFGATGDRGSRIFSGDGEPEDFFLSEVATDLGLQLFDLYVNSDQSSPTYLFMSQYVPGDTGPEWRVLTNVLGSTGPMGPQTSISIGTVTASNPGSSASASVTGPAGNQELSLVIPRGVTGPAGIDGVFLVSATAPLAPAQGDTWFNSGTGKFYVYYDGFWVEISSNKVGETGPKGTFAVSTTAPVSPSAGDTWFNSSAGTFFVYYDNFWVEISANKAGQAGAIGPTGPSGAAGAAGAAGTVGPTGAQGALGPGSQVTVSATAPTTSLSGDLWFDSTDGQTYIRYVDADSSQWVAVSGASATPSFQLGAITPWAANDIPSWALELTGQAVSRTTYSGLFALLGTSYGAGNGTTTFNIPDYRGRTLVGHDASQTEFDVLGEVGGAKTHTLNTDELPPNIYSQALSSPVTASAGATFRLVGTNVTGGSAAHNNLQPYTVVKWIICAASSSGNFDTEVQTALVTNVSDLQVGYRLVETLYITENTNFIKANYPWLRAIRVKCVGAGGGGGSPDGATANEAAASGPGGGGAYAESFLTDIPTLATSVAITVGAGGSGGVTGGAGNGNTGVDGGDSSFGALVSAEGGRGGGRGFDTVNPFFGGSGAGGSTFTGDFSIAGGRGEIAFSLGSPSTSLPFAVGTRGGDSFLGKGAPAVSALSNNSAGGNNGQAPGGGGGGGVLAASTIAQNGFSGGDGAPGIVIIELYA